MLLTAVGHPHISELPQDLAPPLHRALAQSLAPWRVVPPKTVARLGLDTLLLPDLPSAAQHTDAVTAGDMQHVYLATDLPLQAAAALRSLRRVGCVSGEGASGTTSAGPATHPSALAAGPSTGTVALPRVSSATEAQQPVV